MKLSKKNRFEDFESVNCEVCGTEHMRTDLNSIKLSGFNSYMLICDSCKSKDPREQYKTAAATLKEIASAVDEESSPEERIEIIKELLK